MARKNRTPSTRKLFAIFSLIGFIVVSLFYFVTLGPQASEEVAAYTGKLEKNTGFMKDDRPFTLTTATRTFYAKAQDSKKEALNLQLSSFVGKTITVQATRQELSGTNRPGLIIRSAQLATNGGGGTNDGGSSGGDTTTNPANFPQIEAFSATPATIKAGESAKLSWVVGGADMTSINNGIGAVAKTGERTVSPTQTTTYVLTAVNRDGQTEKSVTVTVESTTGGGDPDGNTDPTPTPSPTTGGGGNTVSSECLSDMEVLFVVNNARTMTEMVSVPGYIVRPADYTMQLAEKIGKNLNAADRSAVFSFADPTKVSSGFSNSHQQTVSAVKNLSFTAKSSNIVEGLREGRQYLINEQRTDSSTSKKHPAIVILISDWEAQSSQIPSSLISRIETDYKERDIRYFAVQIGLESQGIAKNFTKVANAGGGKYFSVQYPEEIDKVADRITNGLRKRFSSCISLDVAADRRVVRPGEEVILTFTYKNNSRQAVTDAVITQTLPDGWVTVPEGASTITFNAGRLIPDEVGTRQVKVKLK